MQTLIRAVDADALATTFSESPDGRATVESAIVNIIGRDAERCWTCGELPLSATSPRCAYCGALRSGA